MRASLHERAPRYFSSGRICLLIFFLSTNRNNRGSVARSISKPRRLECQQKLPFNILKQNPIKLETRTALHFFFSETASLNLEKGDCLKRAANFSGKPRRFLENLQACFPPAASSPDRCKYPP